MKEEALQAALWEIVRVVATINSTCEIASAAQCPFCAGDWNYDEEDRVKHEEHCIVTQARALTGKGILAW